MVMFTRSMRRAGVLLAVALLVACSPPGARQSGATPVAAAASPTPSHTPAPLPTPTPAPSTRPSPTPAAPTVTPVQPSPSPSPATGARYQAPGNYLDGLTVGGVSRLFTVHLPPTYQPGVPVPLVLNLHGRGRDMFQQEKVSRMQAKADEAGFIVVNPQALGEQPTWWGPIPGEVGQPDMDFFERLLAYLQGQISVDPDRIYATGLSNGATMANRLGCDMSDTFAAIAPVAGGHVAFDQCQIQRPVSVLAFHGTDDNTIPYYGQGNDVPPVHAWVEAWAQRNDCQAEPITGRPDPHVTTETWTGCAENTEVTLYTLEGGGHTWPGAPLDLDLSSHFVYIDATDLIWQFFAAHPRPSAPEALAAGKTLP